MPLEILLSVYVLAGILGLCVGSFLNVVIYRLPEGMSLATPSSHCTSCGYNLKWYDNIPVFSYLFLGGKCRKCRAKISPRYIAVEILNAILWLACAFLFAENNLVYAILSAFTCSVLICVFFIDLKHLIIFDRFHLIILALGITAIFFDDFTVWYDHLIGGIAGGLVFLLVYYLAILVYKKEGLGFGDVKLVSVCGFFLGWQKLILMVLIATVLASIILLAIKIIKKKERDAEYPFGPFITFSVIVSLLAGEFIINWYLSLLLL